MTSYSGPYFYHQLGNSDQVRCYEMLENGFGQGAILSPRDLARYPNKLSEYALAYLGLQVDLLVDPQVYSPSGAALQNPQFLPQIETNDLLNPDVRLSIVTKSLEQQRALNVTKYIIPGHISEVASDEWLDVIRDLGEGAKTWLMNQGDNRPVLATIALAPNVIYTREGRERLLNGIAGLETDGIYLIPTVPSQPTDDNLLYGLLDIVFRLKRHGYELLMGYTEPWVLITFPFGLDAFASSGLKNRRSFDQSDWRSKKSGGRGPKYNRLWSPILLDNIRYPDDAEFLNSEGLLDKLSGSSPYGPPSGSSSPTEVYETKQWKYGRSLQHYAWTMCELSSSFQNKGREERVDKVRQWLSSAQAEHKLIAQKGIVLPSRGDHLKAWSRAFEDYLADVTDELGDEFN